MWQFVGCVTKRSSAIAKMAIYPTLQPHLHIPHDFADKGVLKAKFHYAILVTDRFEAGRRPATSGNLAYHLAS